MHVLTAGLFQEGDIGMEQLQQFRSILRESLSEKTFVKATLSQNKGEDKVPCRELARTKALWQYSLVAAAAASAAVICGK